MKFNYQTRTKKGDIAAGTIEASSKETAINILQRQGFYVTYLKETRPPFYARQVEIFQKTSLQDIVLFSRQLSIMFSSKVSLIEALDTIAVQTKNLEFKERILDISKEVEGGSPFSKSLSRHPQIFSQFYIAMVKSGETAGKLSASLNYLADHLEREYRLNSRVKGAMLYPAVVVLVIMVVLFVMMFYIIPQLTEVLEETGQALPLVTQLIIKLSIILRKWGVFLFVFFVILVISLQRYIKTSEGKNNFDKISLRLPLIGSSLKMVCLSRFAENLSTLIAGGIPVAQALETSGEIVGNTVYKEIIFLARDEVRKGENISSVLQGYPEIFPPVFSQMASVGEKTGTLDKTLLNLVDFYQREVDRNIENLFSVLEPLLIVFLGVIVAGLMMSILLPLYNMAAF